MGIRYESTLTALCHILSSAPQTGHSPNPNANVFNNDIINPFLNTQSRSNCVNVGKQICIGTEI